jgi:hypothetical protein
VYDQFFCKGKKLLFQVALAIFELLESRILEIHDSLEVVDFVKLQVSSIDCSMLMEVCLQRAAQPIMVRC